MRLINTHTHELVEFFDADIPPYAILSHKVSNLLGIIPYETFETYAYYI